MGTGPRNVCVRGVGHRIGMHADWKVAGSGSLVFGNLQLTGPKKSGIRINAAGHLTLQGVAMTGGDISFTGVVSVTDSTLGSSTIAGSATGAQLSVSGGSCTGCRIQITSFPATRVS